jgi:hypothetical protein
MTTFPASELIQITVGVVIVGLWALDFVKAKTQRELRRIREEVRS